MNRFVRRVAWTLLAVLPLLTSPRPLSATDYKPEELPKEVVVNGVEFLLIPAGWFYKGGGVPDPKNDPTGHIGTTFVKIWLDSFYIAKYEARASDFVRFMNTQGGQENAPLYGGDKEGCTVRKRENGEYYLLFGKGRDLPATHLSWEVANRFATWMGFRLASEAEWEKAARGDSDKRLFPWGNEPPDDTRAAFMGGISCNPVPVDRYPKGASPYGVFNMAGNVREFVADWWNDDHDAQQKDGEKNPPLPAEGKSAKFDKPQKMMKGGRWMIDATGLLIRERVEEEPDFPFRCNGTRFAADVETILKGLVKQP